RHRLLPPCSIGPDSRSSLKSGEVSASLARLGIREQHAPNSNCSLRELACPLLANHQSIFSPSCVTSHSRSVMALLLAPSLLPIRKTAPQWLSAATFGG